MLLRTKFNHRQDLESRCQVLVYLQEDAAGACAGVDGAEAGSSWAPCS